MKDENYITSDLGLSVALLTYGIELVSVDKENPRRVVFVFADYAKSHTTAESYWNGTLKLSVLRYFENTKLLKSRIYGV